MSKKVKLSSNTKDNRNDFIEIRRICILINLFLLIIFAFGIVNGFINGWDNENSKNISNILTVEALTYTFYPIYTNFFCKEKDGNKIENDFKTIFRKVPLYLPTMINVILILFFTLFINKNVNCINLLFFVIILILLIFVISYILKNKYTFNISRLINLFIFSLIIPLMISIICFIFWEYSTFFIILSLFGCHLFCVIDLCIDNNNEKKESKPKDIDVSDNTKD